MSLVTPTPNYKLLVPYEFITTKERAIIALNDCKRQFLLGYDTETNGVDPHNNKILLLQLATLKVTYVFDVVNGLFNDKELLNLLKAVLEDPNIIKIAHNAGFDFKMPYGMWGIKPNPMFDTALAELLLHPKQKDETREDGSNLPSLNEVCIKYLGFGLDKSVREGFYSGYQFAGFSEEQLQYAANDAAVVLRLYEILVEKLDKLDLIRVMELETECIPIVALMEFVGIKLDIEKWEGYLRIIKKEADALKINIIEHLTDVLARKDFWGRPVINISSNAQLLEALNKLGLAIENTKDPTLTAIKDKHPVIPLILEWRGKEKLLSTYGEKLLKKINKKTGRLHGSFWLLGTGSGRLSSSRPNLQNIPRDKFRDCFIAPDGYVWISLDFGSQEYRTMAALSGETGVLAGFKKGLDFHSNTAITVYDHNDEEFIAALKSYKEKKKNGIEPNEFEERCAKERNDCKTMNFLANYGGGAGRLSEVLKITFEEAKQKLYKYNKGLPNMKRFREVEGEKTLARMYSETLIGRKRFYYLDSNLEGEERKKIESKIKRMGVNHRIQGTCADMTKKSLVIAFNELEKAGLDAQIISTVHDEINIYAREDQKDEVAAVAKKAMEDAFYFFIPEEVCPIEVDVAIGAHWIH